MLKKLQQGEIDLLADVSYKEDRVGTMLLSHYAMGKEDYYIFIDPQNLLKTGAIDGLVTSASYDLYVDHADPVARIGASDYWLWNNPRGVSGQYAAVLCAGIPLMDRSRAFCRIISKRR